ncbi:Ig-like domain-containing protein [Halovulum sp. GXIMD14794]
MYFRFGAEVVGDGWYEIDQGLYGVTGTERRNRAAKVASSPTVTLSGMSGTVWGAQTLTAEVSTPAQTLEPGDLIVSNATVTSINASGARTYAIDLVPDAPGPVSVQVKAGALEETAGYSLLSTASNTLTATAEAPTVTADFALTPSEGVSIPHTVFATDRTAVVGGGGAAVTSWQWDFGDGGTSTAQHPVHSYTASGGYAVTLTACSSGVCDTHTDTVKVHAVPGTLTTTLTGLPSDFGAGEQVVTVAFNSGLQTSDPLRLSDFDADGLDLVSLSGPDVTPAYADPQNYRLTVRANRSGTVSLSLPAGAVSNWGGAGNAAGSVSGNAHLDAPRIVSGGATSAGGDGMALVSIEMQSSSPATASSFPRSTGGEVKDCAFHARGSAPLAHDYEMLCKFYFQADGSYTISLPAGAVADGFGNSTAAYSLTIGPFDVNEPVPEIRRAPAVTAGPFEIDIAFSRTVETFEASDVQVSGGTITGFSGSGDSYALRIAPDGTPDISIGVPAGAALHRPSDPLSPGLPSAAAVPVSVAYDGPPVANAGADQTAASGAEVTLDGSISSDPDSTSLRYRWTAPAGITLSDPGSATPVFTAPTLAPGDPDRVLTFELEVDDGTTVLRDSVSVTVMANVAVVLSGLPETLIGPTTITARFSEDVSGFDAGDVLLENLALSEFRRTDRQSYSFVLAPVARGAATVRIGRNAAQDVDGNPNAASNQLATEAFVNGAPVADAGQGRVVGSGRKVTLDGSASADPDGDALQFAWSAPGGVTLSDASAAQPVFTAPELEPGDPDEVLTFTLTVSDGTASASATAEITVRAAVTVTISGLPEQIEGPGEHTVSVVFSRPVTGFEAEDISVEGGAVTTLTGEGARYSATIRASGQGDLVVSVPRNAARDEDRIGNVASNVLRSLNMVVERTSELIAAFMQTRGNNLVSNQPDLAGLLTGNGGGGFSGVITRGQTTIDFVTDPGSPVWGVLRGALTEEGDTDSRYVLGVVGTHAEVRPDVLVGAMLQFDYALSREDEARIEGYGWMAGPYFVARHPSQPVIFDGRLLYGQTYNEAEPLGTYSDEFTTDRWLAQLAVTGEIEAGRWMVYPLFDVSYTTDAQRAYTDSLGNRIPAQDYRLASAELGADLRYQLSEVPGRSALIGGASGILAHSSGSGAAGVLEPSHDGFRMRLELGYERAWANGGRFAISSFTDGIGADGYQSYGMDARLELRF